MFWLWYCTIVIEEVIVGREPACTIGGNVNWYSHYEKQHRGFSKKLRLELPFDPAISLLCIYSENMKTLTQKDTCTSIFITALFTIAEIRKQPKCPLMDACIKKMCAYKMEYTQT